MITKDFYGKDNFIWWTGIVEDRDDPLKLGSVRVRIFGLHSEDKSSVPTENLPWAQVLQPSTGAKTNSGPREGDWVFGFFQDGSYAQIPVVIGVFPGIESVQSQTVYRDVVIKKGAENVPQSTQAYKTEGEPTVVRLARGNVEGSLANTNNQQLVHVCDIKLQVDWAVEHITGFFGLIVQAIRTGIRAAITALGFEPSGVIAKLIQIAKTINKIATQILRTLEKIVDGIQTLVRLVEQIRAMIEYILSLPEKLLRFLRECLQRLFDQIAAGIGSILADPDGATGSFFGEGNDFSGLTQELSELRDSSRQILGSITQIVTAPLQITEAFLNPSSAEDLEAAEKSFGSLIGEVNEIGQTQNENIQYNSQKYSTP
jgi:hypothetical protein